MKLYRIVDETNECKSPWTSDYSVIENQLDGYRWNYNDYKDKDRIFVESMTVVDTEIELNEVYEWNKNKLTTITKKIY